MASPSLSLLSFEILTDKSVCISVRFMQTSLDNSPRERIIATALRLFYSQGYLATGINQIISEAKVAKATFYVHFPAKEALCVAYLQARHVVWMAWLEESVAAKKTAAEKLMGVFDFLKEWMAESNFRGCAFLNIAAEIPSIDSKIRAEVIKHKDDLQAYLQGLVADLVAANPARAGLDAKDTSEIIYVLVEGAIVASQNYGAIWPIEAAQGAVRNLLNL
ncbi:MAG: TetR/AcrR family transcriptional regulator [Thermodesulfobacteriota bacterium]